MAEKDYKGKLLRLFREIMLLTKTPVGLSIHDLEEKLGTSYRTVYRDFELLEKAGFIPEEVTKGKYVIRGFDQDIRSLEKNLRFTSEEAGLISNVMKNVAEGNPLKKSIMEKVQTFSGSEELVNASIKKDLSENVARISKAIREKKQVLLRNYRSSNSSSIKDRLIEPYSFSEDGALIKAYEPSGRANKTFKIERVEEVVVMSDKWQFPMQHENNKGADVFGIYGSEEILVKLRMTLRAANLMKEEFPQTSPDVYKEDHSHYIFEAPVSGYQAVGRFVLGLIDEVEVISPDSLKEYLSDKISKRKK